MTNWQIVSWNLTRRCNLACGHCYLDATQRQRPLPGELDTAACLGVIAQLAEVAPGAMLVLTGGEPLLRFDLEELVRAASQAGLLPVVGSNGIVLDQRRARTLKNVGAAGVGISLDAIDQEGHDTLRGFSGAMQGALQGIAAARAVDLPVQLQTTIFEYNRRQVSRLVGLAHELGAVAINFFFLVCTGRGSHQTDLTPEAYEETLEDILRLQEANHGLLVRVRCAPYMRRLQGLKNGEERGSLAAWSGACLAGRSYFRITPEGRVTPCPYLPLEIGDLREQPLARILAEAPALVRLSGETPGGKCGLCDYRISCGGCRARAFAVHGDLMGEDPKCRHIPRADAVPELSSATAPVSDVAWHPDCAPRLARIPAFLRDRVRRHLEEQAKIDGVTVITPEYMMIHRPARMARAEMVLVRAPEMVMVNRIERSVGTPIVT